MSCGVPPPNGNEAYARQIQAEEEQIASNENLARKLAREGEFDPNFNTNGDAALAQRLSYANSNEDYENILSEHDYVRSAVLETKPLSPEESEEMLKQFHAKNGNFKDISLTNFGFCRGFKIFIKTFSLSSWSVNLGFFNGIRFLSSDSTRL